jgi:large subunit ribosomal protein L17
MRHNYNKASFGREIGPKQHLLRGLVYSLVENGRITTTVAKAKELRRHIERAITTGKAGTLHARRQLLQKFPNEKVVNTMISDLAARFKKRPGGYTRVVRVGLRAGDKAEMALIEFVDYKPVEKTAETVKGDKDLKARMRLKARKTQAKRRNHRKLQSKARQMARAQ